MFLRIIVHVHKLCMPHTVISSSLCKWKRPKLSFFVVKWYAVCETKKWWYAVCKSKIGGYAVCKGEEVSPSCVWEDWMHNSVSPPNNKVLELSEL